MHADPLRQEHCPDTHAPHCPSRCPRFLSLSPRKEFKKLQKEPVQNIEAVPLESNILEWHYVIQGPPDSPYDGGFYHGMLRCVVVLFDGTLPLACQVNVKVIVALQVPARVPLQATEHPHVHAKVSIIPQPTSPHITTALASLTPHHSERCTGKACARIAAGVSRSTNACA